MSIEDIVDDLRTLPPARLEMVADFVRSLTRISDEERRAILARTSGVLSAEEADEWQRVIEDGGGRVDHGHTGHRDA